MLKKTFLSILFVVSSSVLLFAQTDSKPPVSANETQLVQDEEQDLSRQMSMIRRSLSDLEHRLSRLEGTVGRMDHDLDDLRSR